MGVPLIGGNFQITFRLMGAEWGGFQALVREATLGSSAHGGFRVQGMV